LARFGSRLLLNSFLDYFFNFSISAAGSLKGSGSLWQQAALFYLSMLVEGLDTLG
jgi:hypothetical protein